MLEVCDVIIAGGGPAGASCAWKLRRAGLDVIVLDQASFPRDKVCAGWITPQVIADLALDLDDYRRGRTLQPFTAFRVGVIGQDAAVDTGYSAPVSFGIRRCEFDHYLLKRAEARVRTGEPLSSIRRDGSSWIVNESVTAPMLVGAAGHFCPVARMLNGTTSDRPLVIAQEAEFPIDLREIDRWPIAPERPELYFSRDLDGYGWCLRKEQHVNVGFGCLSRRKFPVARAAFVAFLRRIGRVPDEDSWRWRGHAYYLSAPARRRVVEAGVVLAGDAAGLAYPQSGEGIRPAIESGLMAASAILDSNGEYSVERLALYERKLHDRFGLGRRTSVTWPNVPASLSAALGRWLLRRPQFVRQIVIDRWFLHAQVAPLASALS
jgi:geranylgeranyl reductase family protein